MLSKQLSALTVRRNRIVISDTREPIILRGINRSGLEYHPPRPSDHLEHAGFTATDFNEMANWGATLIRLPINQSWALPAENYDPEPYLSSIDQIVQLAAERGAYTLLDLQWLDAKQPRGFHSDGSPNFVPPLPNLDSILLWSQLASRYKNEPAVLYDIFNEPHDRLANDPFELQGINQGGTLNRLRRRRVGMKEWQPWATHLVNAIRKEHPEALIVVSGIDWGFDLRGFPLPGIDDVVYSSHVYPNKHLDWQRIFGHVAEFAPVLIGEWGGGENDLEWGSRLLAFMNERDLSWAAWSWSDKPFLVQKDLSYQPTLFGRLVRRALLEGKDTDRIQG